MKAQKKKKKKKKKEDILRAFPDYPTVLQLHMVFVY